MQQLLKADEVYKLLNLNSKQSLYALVRKGDVFPPGIVIRFNRLIRFELSALQTWLANGGTLSDETEVIREVR